MAKRKDYSQKIYEEFLTTTEAEFKEDMDSEFMKSMVCKNKLFLKGLMADGAMFFTTDPLMYERAMRSEKGRYWREYMASDKSEDSHAVGRVYDYGESVQRGFSLSHELPMPFDNVLVVTESDKEGKDGSISRGRKTMVFTHDTARLKDFTPLLSSVMKMGDKDRTISLQASFENNMVSLDGNKIRHAGWLEDAINMWMISNPDLVK